MLNAVGSISYGNAPSAGASTAVLEAQLVQCERQLSDWTHCSSAKTPEGKDIIQTLTNRISEIKVRLEKSVTAKSDAPSVTVVPTTAINPAAAPRPANGGVGSLLDVFA
ncbi:MAG: hypothetical protein LLG15_10140 [Betaproteobacteria bacterium]|nr:hypothetical protein [Betaproteobacteria bacterium]